MAHAEKWQRGVPCRTVHISDLQTVGAREWRAAEAINALEPDLIVWCGDCVARLWRSNGRAVDLHLAGHTHGGQIALPFFGPPVTLSSLPRRFARGLHRFGDHWLHVTPGIGMEGSHAPRIRFLCPPSIDLIELRGGAEPLPEKTMDSSGRSNVQ